ncbi:DUF4082 domain-containing protein [Nocardioides nematodiphilus]|uniref:DUF4082 domain-containing protein n=1 Tax=Nocardioides nematodiphilus TaxID=2849669 RepID=UPI001CD9C471|nr:DUF4082 domain-containing protein [Nocardioides nematodiphilus]
MRGRHLAAVLVLVLTGMFLAALSVAPPSAAADPCGSGGNPVACENSKPGTPESEWEITGAGDSDIQGFSTDISVNAGSTIGFKIDTDARAYGITILRMGWYGGDGARQITTITPSATLPQTQPPCITDSTTELTDCGNWGLSASWAVPSTAVSGVYIAHLERVDNGDDSNITFIVRNDASHSAVVFQTSDPTWEAYNTYGGSDFYQGGAHGRAYKVSYNRPMLARLSPGGQDFLMANEYPAIRFLERNGYDLSYISGVDTDRYGSLLKNHQVFLSVGHDEYWSGAQRANVEAARDAGVNLQFLSGNEVYWRTRYETSIDAGHTPYRTLVTYKEAWAQAKIDPSPESTSTWRDPRYAPTSQGGGRPENALSGTTFMSNYTDLPLTVTRAQGSLRLWRNTGLSSMSGASTSLAPHTVGYESDEDQDNGFRPAGLIDLSTTTGQVSNYMTDYGLNTTSATTTHSLTLYKAPSGALVFSAGSVQWAWGLDDDHDTPYAYAPADSRMQQAQVNVLADMGVQPTTLMSGLSAASKSADVTAPTVTISSPAAGTAIANGTRVTVSGSASDPSGSGVAGVVAGVEYSLDGGTSWHPAQGTSSWSFTYTQHGSGTVPVQVRAVDDSANIGTAVSRSFAVACPCSIFGATPLPTTWTSVTGPSAPADTSDGSAVELGLRFTPQSDGFISGVRFYKGTGNTGTHVGSLWDSSGQRLGSVTFANETATGWQQATFGAGIPVSAGQTYTVSYTAPNGHYAYQYWAFNEAPLLAPPLQVAGGFGAAPAGVYALAGKYPQSNYEGSQYYVDALFTTTDSAPLSAGSQWPAADAASVPPSTTIRATFSRAVVASSVSVSVKDAAGASVAGTTTYDSTSRTVTFTPSAALAGATKYTVTLAATDPTGVALSAGKSWSFTTAVPQSPPGVCPCSLFSDSTTPTLLEAVDTNQVTLGVSFSADTAGAVTGIRFYKGPNNTGTHTGTLWSAGGVKLAEGTFTNEPSSGWATLTFSQPVSIAKNTTYVASYRTEVGNYSATPNAFAASDLSYGPLHVTSTAGAYSYGAAFPTTATSNSYLVDLVFTPTGSTGSTGLTLFPGQVPQYASTDDSAAVELGTAFVPAKDGVVSGIGFYKGSGNDGTHVGHLWSASGALLASVTFTGESSQGWQTATLSTPVSVTAGTTYVVSYLAPLGHYANTPNYFASDYTAGGLTAPAGSNGRYLYGAGGGFPTSTYQATNYFVDVAYTAGGVAPSPSPSASASASATPTATASASPSVTVSPSATPSATPPPLTITSRTPASGASNVSRSVKPAATLSATLAGGTISLKRGTTTVTGTSVRSGSTLTFTPSSRLSSFTSYTVTITGATSTAGATLPTTSWTFTTGLL